MKTLQQSFSVAFQYPVHFTQGIFQQENPLIRNIFSANLNGYAKRKVFVVIDDGVQKCFPTLHQEIKNYFSTFNGSIELCGEPLIIPGGEFSKNDNGLARQIIKAINDFGIDRHSYVIAIGGGAMLDLVGFAAAIAHRGIRHIRIPTTVLSQNDSGVGVKNGINAFGKKNFLGTFVPPYAVINDSQFLTSLHDRDWRSGIAEAIKVALIKDASFFKYIEEHTTQLLSRDMATMEQVIYHCAELHLNHIRSGDPFELGTSRPLDFGHWSAHKLEQLTLYSIRHGEAVALGIALDSTYSYLSGMLPERELEKILSLLKTLKFELYIPEMSFHLEDEQHPLNMMNGLNEFREHLGGVLTIMLLEQIGRGVEVHEMNLSKIREAVRLLEARSK
ncbi:MAG: 3-dehydroquinate synthase [Ignavibacteriae bacterium]|nr:3-dehydroquinate synthase [Ignavibacteriota bacterium]